MISFSGKKVLFITTKNIDYIRNVQEIELLEKSDISFRIIGSKDKSYPVRLLKIYWDLLWHNFREYDVVFIGFAPQLIVPFWYWKFRKQKLVIDFFISLYDTFVFDRKKIKEQSFGGRLLKTIDRITLEKAEYIICDTKAHGDYFAEEFGICRKKVETLYLEADKKIYYPREMKKGEGFPYTVLYFGSILPLQGVDVVLKAAERLKEEKDIKFVIIGPIEEKYDMPISNNIEYIQWLTQNELAERIAAADLCLAGHFNNSINKAKRTIPGKAYIYQAMGKPMILGDNEANRELYSENMSGIHYVEMGNPEALVQCIEKCKKEMYQSSDVHISDK